MLAWPLHLKWDHFLNSTRVWNASCFVGPAVPRQWWACHRQGRFHPLGHWRSNSDKPHSSAGSEDGSIILLLEQFRTKSNLLVQNKTAFLGPYQATTSVHPTPTSPNPKDLILFYCVFYSLGPFSKSLYKDTNKYERVQERKELAKSQPLPQRSTSSCIFSLCCLTDTLILNTK